MGRNLVLSTYREPQIPDLETLSEIVTRHIFDYRRVFIEQPRVRTDGVYIAICHYMSVTHTSVYSFLDTISRQPTGLEREPMGQCV